MIQDAPVSGTVLRAALLARMAREIEQVSYFKIETAGAASKLRELIRLGGDAIEGPWDGEEGITLLPDLEAGATGAMTGGGYPDGIRTIVDAFVAGRRDEAFAQYQRWLPLINYENRQCGLLAAKALMKEGGVIACDAPRHPFAPLHPAVRAGCSTPRAASTRWCCAGDASRARPAEAKDRARRVAPNVGYPVHPPIVLTRPVRPPECIRMTRVFNFSAGPAALPEPVLRQAAEEMLDWHGSGMSVMEMSHRGKEFIAIHAEAEGLLRKLSACPPTTRCCSCRAARSARTRSCR